MQPINPCSKDMNASKHSAAGPYGWGISIAIALMVGESLGKQMGGQYDGIGFISGERIGEWLGEGIGLATAVVLIGWISSPWFKNAAMPFPRRFLAAIAIWFLLLMTAICAIAGKAYLGEWGGLIGVIAYGAFIGLAILIASRVRSGITQRS